MTLGLEHTDNDKALLIANDQLENVKMNEIIYSENNGSKISHRGVSVIWKNLNVAARVKKQHYFRSTTYEEKEIIKNVSGCVHPANLVAILGASGSGKSTLMSVLASRQLDDLKVRGDICINGRKIDMKYLKQISGFVYQDDLFVPTLTVLEHLYLAAQIKLDRRISAEYKKKLMYDLLTEVGLLKCANNSIGSSDYGQEKVNLSGGEKKRLSVATELITDPSLLFCDEPTTGLDSYSAFKLVTLMRNMANQKNKTIICSIHQPNEQIFSLFNQIILLHKGEIAFIGSNNDALEFFKSLGYHYDTDQNPAEYFVKSLAVVPGNETESSHRVSNICKQFKDSKYAKDINNFIEEERKKLTDNPSVQRKVQRISWIYMLYLLTYRNFLQVKRDLSVQGMKLLNKEIMALVIGLCLMGTTGLTQEGIHSLKGALFTMVAENFFPPLYGVLNHIPSQMPVFYREYTNNMNTPLIFFLSNIFSLLPGYILDPIIFTTILYVFAGLKPILSTFLLTVFINFLVVFTSSAFGMLLSLVSNGYEVAAMISTPIDCIYLILAGIFMNLRTVPAILSWVRYISWMTYAVEALLILQLQDVDSIACSDNPNLPCLQNGTQVLNQLDFNMNNLLRNILLMIVLCLALHIAAYVTLRVKLYYRLKR